MQLYKKTKILTLLSVVFLLMLMLMLMVNVNLPSESSNDKVVEMATPAQASDPDGWVICNETEEDGNGQVLSCKTCTIKSGIVQGEADMCNTCEDEAEPIGTL